MKLKFPESITKRQRNVQWEIFFFLIKELDDEARRSNVWQIRISERKLRENRENKIIKEIIPEIFPELKGMSLQIEEHAKYPNNKRTKAYLYDILEHQG